jgi:hypothetical protein
MFLPLRFLTTVASIIVDDRMYLVPKFLTQKDTIVISEAVTAICRGDFKFWGGCFGTREGGNMACMHFTSIRSWYLLLKCTLQSSISVSWHKLAISVATSFMTCYCASRQTLQHTLVNSVDGSPQTNPLIIRIDTKAGHGAGRPTKKIVSPFFRCALVISISLLSYMSIRNLEVYWDLTSAF